MRGCKDDEGVLRMIDDLGVECEGHRGRYWFRFFFTPLGLESFGAFTCLEGLPRSLKNDPSPYFIRCKGNFVSLTQPEICFSGIVCIVRSGDTPKKSHLLL
jgi:hypothetical protein